MKALLLALVLFTSPAEAGLFSAVKSWFGLAPFSTACRYQYAKLDVVLLQEGMYSAKLKNIANIESTAAAARMSIEHMSVPAAKELAEMLETATRGESGARELKAKVEAWMKRNNLPLRLIYGEEVEAEIGKLVKRGLLSPGDHVQDHGYIEDKAWNLLISEGKFPVMDPHDLVSHLPSQLLPGYPQALQARSRFTVKWLGVMGKDYVPTYANWGDPGGVELHTAMSWMGSAVRNQTHENLVYLDYPGGKPTLVVHGNFAFRFADVTRSENGIGQIVELMMGKFGFESTKPGLDDIKGFREFLLASGRRDFLDLLQKLGMEEPARHDLRRKLIAIVDKIDRQGNVAGETGVDRASRVLGAVAKAASRDPDLRELFNAENRIRLLRESAELLDAFLEKKRASP